MAAAWLNMKSKKPEDLILEQQAALLEQQNMPVGKLAQMADQSTMSQEDLGVTLPTNQPSDVVGGAQGMPQVDPYQMAFNKAEELRAAAQQYNLSRQKDLEDMQKDISEYERQSSGVDWRPLAAMIDQWSGGGNLYRLASDLAPESPAVKKAKIQEMKKQLSLAKNQMAKDDYTSLKDQLDVYLAQLKSIGAEKTLDKKLTAAAERARLMAGQKAEQPTAGQKAADVAAGKEYSEYVASGGSETINKNIGLLESAISDLSEPDEISGGISGFAGEGAQDVLNPRGAAVRDKIRSAIQGTLKQVLGGQFTEKEAQAMFSRAYNPRLSDEENIRRASAELQALKNMAAKKQESMQFFEQTGGTLKGYKGAAPKAPSTKKPSFEEWKKMKGF